MSTYSAPIDDMQFVVKELIGLEQITSLPGCEEATPDLVDAVIEEAGKFASGVLDPLNQPGDQHGAALNEHVDQLRNENQNLITTVGLQEAELSDKEAQIIIKQQELALIEAKIQELMIASKVSEADSYFARAQAVEEAANRTKLAPKKKKETLQEAIELYKKSLSLGKQEAEAKIAELEKKI